MLQKHRSTGVIATVTIPTGQAYRAAAGWSVLTMDGNGALHVLRTVDGTLTVDTPVTGFPAGARPVLYRTGGSVTRLAIVYALDGKTSVGLVDLSDGAFRTYVTGDEATPQLAFNDRWLVADWKAFRVDAEPGTAPTALARTDAQLEAVVGRSTPDRQSGLRAGRHRGRADRPLPGHRRLGHRAPLVVRRHRPDPGRRRSGHSGTLQPRLEHPPHHPPPAPEASPPPKWPGSPPPRPGKIVRTLTGSSTGVAVRPAWDGTTDSGSGTTGGAYTWKLTAHPRDGQGPDLTLSGTMTLG
ncbi:hypothetical protein ABZ613_39585 [Streptomyces collinus]|uniref:hypothetical protein n=1 Tax=Streptomyces collinus TaxID=42684 RepID=UPI0033ECDC29